MKQLHKLIQFVFLGAFLVILILPILNSSFEIWTFERKSENRVFRDSLEIDINNLDIFPKHAKEYVKDNFSFRTPLLETYHDIKFSYFNISPYPEQTIVGTDGWFFMSRKEIDIYEGKHNFSRNQLDTFQLVWEKRKDYLDKMGTKLYWYIAPFKHYVYSEYLPFNTHQFSPKRVDVLLPELENSLGKKAVDLADFLTERKKDYKLFRKLDNHWNHRAGHLLSEFIVKQLQEDFPEKDIPNVPSYEWHDTVVSKGFHYNIIGIKDLQETESEALIESKKAVRSEKYGFPPIEEFPYKSEYEERFLNANLPNGLRVLFIRDSFCGLLIPFITESFQETELIWDSWQYGFDKEIIDRVKPDAVIYMSLETHIDHILNNASKELEMWKDQTAQKPQ